MVVNCDTIVIDGTKEYSYVLNGLVNQTVVFKNKIKHLVVRKCIDSKIYINCGTIAGIDILFCFDIFVRTNKHNYTNIEESLGINVFGQINKTTLIHAIKSIDITVNNNELDINLFTNKQLKMDSNENNKRRKTMSISPVADSCNERWQTKLMMMGRKMDQSSTDSSTDSNNDSSTDSSNDSNNDSSTE